MFSVLSVYFDVLGQMLCLKICVKFLLGSMFIELSGINYKNYMKNLRCSYCQYNDVTYNVFMILEMIMYISIFTRFYYNSLRFKCYILNKQGNLAGFECVQLVNGTIEHDFRDTEVIIPIIYEITLINASPWYV